MWLTLAAILVVIAGIFTLLLKPRTDLEEKAKGRRRSGIVLDEVITASAFQPASLLQTESGFAPQTRLGYPGDQWEPAIAADRYGHVYVLYPSI
jgi:hypothetical protein